jgi:hypothetical protein
VSCALCPVPCVLLFLSRALAEMRCEVAYSCRGCIAASPLSLPTKKDSEAILKVKEKNRTSRRRSRDSIIREPNAGKHAVTLNPFLWDVSPCHWLIDVRRFGTAQWSRFQGPNAKVREAETNRK